MTANRHYRFSDGKELTIGGRTLVMGILNVTPDSFSDGGKWNTRDDALRHMEEMVRDGADIIDVGAESSRPGFVPMSAAEETERLLPFLEAVLPACPVPVSVDTFKAETARAALRAGAHLLNDIWGLQYAEEPGAMARAAAEMNAPVVVMHNQNGTTLHVLRRMDELISYDGIDYSMLLGASRKSFIGAALGLPVTERMEATGAACVLGILRGASIVRVHDVKPIARMCRMTDAILGA